MRPLHEYNANVGGNMPQVPVLSKLAMLDQRHDGITFWHASQVEGLVTVKVVQVQVLSPAVYSTRTCVKPMQVLFLCTLDLGDKLGTALASRCLRVAGLRTCP